MLVTQMEDEFPPDTQPAGALGPPLRGPPMAAGLATSGPNPEPSGSRSTVVVAAKPNWLGVFLLEALDALDELGDMVADAFHVRPSRPSK
jgi:hypothetical protein